VRGWRGSSGNVGWLLPVISDEKSTVGSLDSDSSSQFSLLKLEFGGSESTWHPSSSMPHSDSSDPVSEIDSLNRTPPPVDSNLNDPNTALREPSEALSGIADLFLTPLEVDVRLDDSQPASTGEPEEIDPQERSSPEVESSKTKWERWRVEGHITRLWQKG
jgi:hypothetical protein